jgi:hypothetical protein
MHEYQKACPDVFASHAINNERAETALLPGKELLIARTMGVTELTEEG